MTLSATRVVEQGTTPYNHERQAIDFAVQALPNTDPYQLWALTELLDPTTGRLYELDMVILGYSALYLVEVKSGPGLYTGDALDWYRTPPGDDRPRYLENPFRLTNHKSKVLASRLRYKLRDPKHAPWVQPLVFLSAEDLHLKLSDHGDLCVVTRDTFRAAIERGDFPGADGRQRPRVNRPAMQDIAQALRAIGLRPKKGKAHVGAYELGAVLAEGSGFQDRHATHRDNSNFEKRARIYAVPQASSIDRRQQLARAAARESQLLYDVRDHPNILRIEDFVTDAEVGPTVLFDAFPGGVPLDAFLRREKPDFYSRVELIEQVARALQHCHKKRIVHGALSPEAVLVRRHPETNALEVRLYNFQLGLGPAADATAHWSALGSDPWAIYQAPELRDDPNARSPASDVFSLGALAYLVFTDRAPGATAVDIDRHLAEHGHLDPRAVDDSLIDAVGQLVTDATERCPANRIDNPEEWIELLLGEVTRPAERTPSTPEQDPLAATPGDALGDDLLVVPPDHGVGPVLGQGATSRVLQVARLSDERNYALKVSLSTDHDERLDREAAELARLRHPYIVQLVDRLTFAGRPCLLLSLAGTETLHRHLAREGTVSLELAARYGADLLSILDYLEEQRVLHRDIKPANIGVGSVANKATHLYLFDFSLAATPQADLHVGTAAYRDPFLRLRGAWDHAAERFSAAVTLHEMLTGIRPTVDSLADDPDASLVLAVERFDPAVRAQLTAFFTRALAQDVEARFASAAEMRRAWDLALDAQAAANAEADATPEASQLSDEALSAIPPDTAIEALPLSPRARNALDRAGLLTADDLRRLADNRLSAIRGIGSAVAREILDFRDRWAASQTDAAPASEPFFPSYRGDDIGVASAGFGETVQKALHDAGLTTLAAVAEAPRAQVRALSQRHAFDLHAVRDLLARENASANERERPSTLEGWVEALLPQKTTFARARALFGVDPPFKGQLDLPVRTLAEECGVTTAAIYIALGKARDQWAKHGALFELRDHAHAIVDQDGGATPIATAARALMARIPYSRATPEPDLVASAAALLRVVAEVEKDADDGLRTLRLEHNTLWLCASDAHARGVRGLGAAADQLAARPSVPGPGEAGRAFDDAAAGTPLATLGVERQATLAAAASTGAARSARLEIYPRDMEPERALALSASQLKSGLTPAEIVRRVKLRYPEARALPTRPDLDALLQQHSLVFDEVSGTYIRPGEDQRTLMSSRVSSLLRMKTALPSQALAMSADAVAARQFDERLRNAFERHEVRVLGVRADRAREAAIALGDRLGTAPVPFDQRLVAAIKGEMKKGGVKREDPIHRADREGRTGNAWKNLLRLVEQATDTVTASLLPPKEPLLLVQPGLIARYRLDGFIEQLLAGPRDAPVFLLVPSVDTGGIPTINGEYAIPGLLASQVLWVSLDWLSNQHNRAA
jgi:serine/threonine protein kinase